MKIAMVLVSLMFAGSAFAQHDAAPAPTGGGTPAMEQGHDAAAAGDAHHADHAGKKKHSKKGKGKKAKDAGNM